MHMNMNSMFMNPMGPMNPMNSMSAMQMNPNFSMGQPPFQQMLLAMPPFNTDNSTKMNILLENLRDYILFLQDFLKYLLYQKISISTNLEKDTINKFVQKIENFSYCIKLMIPASKNKSNGLLMNNTNKNNNDNIMNKSLTMNQMGQINQFTLNSNFADENKIEQIFKEIIIIIEQFLRELIVKHNQKNNYFEVNEIQLRNDNIVFKIEKKIFEFSNINEKYELETVGKFLYSIGGIARKSLSISNQIYREYFEEFKKKSQFHNFNPYEMRKNFSIFVKNSLDGDNFKKYYKRNILKIMKYLGICPDESEFLIELFDDMLQLYFECALTFPNIVEIKFYDNKNNEFVSDEMTDLIYKGKPTKVNFCYLPQLKSNGAVLNGGKFYVFTYIVEGKKTFKQEEIDYEEVEQNLMN